MLTLSKMASHYIDGKSHQFIMDCKALHETPLHLSALSFHDALPGAHSAPVTLTFVQVYPNSEPLNMLSISLKYSLVSLSSSSSLNDISSDIQSQRKQAMLYSLYHFL